MNIKKETFESRFDRKFACFMKYGIKKIKKMNHKKFRRKVKDETREALHNVLSNLSYKKER